jgi:signal peptidase I
MFAKRAVITGAILCTAYIQPFRPMVVVGHSMEPTYKNASVVLTEPVRPDQIRPGQVVVIDMDSGPIVKRIAFGPGDQFMQAFLAGKWTDLIYVRPTGRKSLANYRWREYTIPPGKAYVLGDNQAVSYDSKQFGCVSLSRIHRILLDQRGFDLFSNFDRPRPRQNHKMNEGLLVQKTVAHSLNGRLHYAR